MSITTTQLDLSFPAKGESENEKHDSLTIFFILLVIGKFYCWRILTFFIYLQMNIIFVAIGICVMHFLLQTKFKYLPESVAVVLIGKLLRN